MRIQRLDLLRYGRFAGTSLSFDDSARDFHLILGRNEAGKSTTRAAIADLLFGIDARPRYGYEMEYSEMRIGAVLAHDGRRLEFRRRKGLKGTLRDPLDSPIPDTALAPFIGTTDRHSFERMFSLDRETLEAGGREILDAQDDVGRMLFQASAGMGSFSRVLAGLEQEAQLLWGPKRKADRAYYVALDALETADEALKTATTRTREWKAAQEAKKAKTDALVATTQRLREAEANRARLERVKRVAPAVARHGQLLQALESLAPASSLPDDAARTVREARENLELSGAELQAIDEAIANERGAYDAACVDERILASSERIEQLLGRHNQVGPFSSDIEKRRGEASQLEADALSLARRIGLEASGIGELRERPGIELAVARLRALMVEKTKVQADAKKARLDEAENARQSERRAALLAESDGGGPPALLRDALERARALGDVVAKRQELVAALTPAEARAVGAMRQVAPWAGSIVDLRSLVVPNDGEVALAATHFERAREARRVANADLARERSNLAEQRVRESGLRRDKKPVTAEELAVVRARRDELWSELRGRIDGLVVTSDLASRSAALEAAIRESDALADRRFDAASASAALENLGREIETLSVRVANLERQVAAADDDLAAPNATVARWGNSLGMAFENPQTVSAWLERRARALESADVAATALGAVDEYDRTVERAKSGLMKVLQQVGTRSADPAKPFAELVVLASAALGKLDDQKKRKEEAAAELEELRREHSVLTQACLDTGTVAESWSLQWASTLRELGLPVETESEVAETALSRLSEIAIKLTQAAQIRTTRIDTMQRDLDAFEEMVSKFVADVAPDLSTRPAASAVRELDARLQTAKRAKQDRDAAATRLADHVKRRQIRVDSRTAAAARLKPLFDRLNTQDLGILESAIAHDERRRVLEKEFEDVKRNLLEIGDGIDVITLLTEVTSEDLLTLEARLVESKREAADLDANRQQLAIESSQADAVLGSISGQASAAEAATQRHEALASMTDSVERYVRVRTAVKLMKYAIEKFRRTQQGPLLDRASAIFSTLTLGELVRLVVDLDDKDQPHLIGLRQSGSRVTVDGMSAGTADQLYMALRIAALESHLAGATPLPFIADDLLVQYDDQRAAAGFQVLSELATKTQVIFFSHHDHLADVAQRALGATGINVLRL